MTQRDPADLPDPRQAIPMLSYERQTDDGTAEWMVRFVGAWILCTAAASILFYSVQMIMNVRMGGIGPQWGHWFTPMASDVASIVFGIAIVRRQRYGFYGKMAEVVVTHLLRFGSTLLTGSLVAVLASIPSLLPSIATFAMLLSVFRRADAKGALQPARANPSPHEGGCIPFLVTRMGWIYLAQGAMVILHLAVWPLLIWRGASTGGWSWTTSVAVAMYLALGVCGLALSRGRLWALWLLIVVLPMHTASQSLMLWWYYSQSGIPFSARAVELSAPVIGTIPAMCMLYVLARKATGKGYGEPD